MSCVSSTTPNGVDATAKNCGEGLNAYPSPAAHDLPTRITKLNGAMRLRKETNESLRSSSMLKAYEALTNDANGRAAMITKLSLIHI